MEKEFGRVAVLFFFAILFPSLPLIASLAFRMLNLRPKAPDPVKNDIYECGVETEGDSWVQFNFRYYLVALLFVIFDVEVVFLYSWAVAFRDNLTLGFIEALTFIGILVLGFVYAWRHRALEWR
jgi:NADH-quinone oxidoreductase subunit A